LVERVHVDLDDRVPKWGKSLERIVIVGSGGAISEEQPLGRPRRTNHAARRRECAERACAWIGGARIISRDRRKDGPGILDMTGKNRHAIKRPSSRYDASP